MTRTYLSKKRNGQHVLVVERYHADASSHFRKLTPGLRTVQPNGDVTFEMIDVTTHSEGEILDAQARVPITRHMATKLSKILPSPTDYSERD